MARTKQYMSLREIQELIKMLGKSNVSEISIERDSFKITLRTHDPHGPAQIVSQSIPQIQQPAILPPPISSAKPAPSTKTEVPKEEVEVTSNLITIKSPMIGTFYRSSTPEKPPLINIGDEIKEGSVLCIIEAMKLFNEIESEYSGRVVKILVENAKPVEYDTPLFLIEPL